MYWNCPKCKSKVDFTGKMEYMFDEEGEADFDPVRGLYFHTIYCKCGVYWVVTISKMN